MATVIVYRDEILRTNETFIHNQVGLIREHQIKYVGLEPTVRSLPLNAPAILLSGRRSKSSKARSDAYRAISIAPAFHRKLLNTRPCLIHAHFSQNATTILPFARRAAIPLLVTLHGSFETVPPAKLVRGLNSLLFVLKRGELWQYTSQFLCVSDFVRQQAINFGFPEQKLRVHYIGVDIDYFSPSAELRDRDLVLFTGRLAEKKGCEYLLRAMQIVRQQRPTAKLVVIGSGELREALEQLNQRVDVRAEFIGEQPSSVIRDWLRRARVFCGPSVTAASGDMEGLPMVLCEAQGVGTPVVSTRHAGIPEIVRHEQTGLLAEERDYKQLADHILKLLTDDRTWTQYSRAGRELVTQQFDLRTQTQQLEELYSLFAAKNIQPGTSS
ncbi:MAG TPA: glycosyltransferase [Bryobacteraceae bacterium]|jgi:glycosyltransferase involved in cell wall biosynthesis|nr:glycosyltransferase [Bryobacteraceae bacterium]